MNVYYNTCTCILSTRDSAAVKSTGGGSLTLTQIITTVTESRLLTSFLCNVGKAGCQNSACGNNRGNLDRRDHNKITLHAFPPLSFSLSSCALDTTHPTECIPPCRESAYMESAKCLRNQALFHIVGRSLLPFGWLISSCYSCLKPFKQCLI